MRAINILRGKLKKKLEFLHAKTHGALWRGVEGLVNGGRLWLTALGREMPGDCSDKHRIKAADRLLGNEALQYHLLEIYRVVACYLMAELKRPCISVDWTGSGPRHYALTASLSFHGRSLPILSRIFPEAKKGSRKAEREFLKQLAQLMPSKCTPILITDAAFYLNWFDQVRALHWDFIGRIRGRLQVCLDNKWKPLSTLHKKARKRPLDIGVVPVRRHGSRALRVVVASKRKSKGRKRLTLEGTSSQNTESQRNMSAAREPWVLATSLADSPKAIVARYALRMQIEECFRDLKAHRHGWSLDFVRSRNRKRVEILLLIAALATIVMHVVGLAAEQAKVHFGYQANTVRNRRVFSTFFLARLLIGDGLAGRLKPDQLRDAFVAFQTAIFTASELT